VKWKPETVSGEKWGRNDAVYESGCFIDILDQVCDSLGGKKTVEVFSEYLA